MLEESTILPGCSKPVVYPPAARLKLLTTSLERLVMSRASSPRQRLLSRLLRSAEPSVRWRTQVRVLGRSRYLAGRSSPRGGRASLRARPSTPMSTRSSICRGELWRHLSVLAGKSLGAHVTRGHWLPRRRREASSVHRPGRLDVDSPGLRPGPQGHKGHRREGK